MKTEAQEKKFFWLVLGVVGTILGLFGLKWIGTQDATFVCCLPVGILCLIGAAVGYYESRETVMEDLRNLFRAKPPITITESEFDALAVDFYQHISEWQLQIIVNSKNYPMPSLEAVNAFARETQLIPPKLLDDIQELDGHLQLGGKLFNVCQIVALATADFKATPDGSGFQHLGGLVKKAIDMLSKLREKHFGSDFKVEIKYHLW